MNISRQYEQPDPLEESWHSFYEQQQQEGPATDTQQQQQPNPSDQQQQQPQDEDPFAGIPVDELSDAAKQALEKAKISYANTAKAQRELTERLDKTTKVASQYQSRADQAIAKLKHHGLLDDGNGVNKVVKTPEEQQTEMIAAEYVKRGMKPDQAAQWAEMMGVAIGVVKPGILNEVGTVLGPAITRLNTISADRYLSAYSSKPDSQVALQVPGVVDGARGIIDTMIANGQQITEHGVDAAIKMALGEALMKSNGDISKLRTVQTAPPVQPTAPNILQTLFGGASNGNGHFLAQTTPPTNGAPAAANAETAKAAAELAALMDRQIGKSKK